MAPDAPREQPVVIPATSYQALTIIFTAGWLHLNQTYGDSGRPATKALAATVLYWAWGREL